MDKKQYDKPTIKEIQNAALVEQFNSIEKQSQNTGIVLAEQEIVTARPSDCEQKLGEISTADIIEQ